MYESERRHADKLAEELHLGKSQVVVIPSIQEPRQARKKQGG